MPPGLRLILGIVLIIGGVFGFLPILGFWMIPLGVAVAALDIRPLYRHLHGKDMPPTLQLFPLPRSEVAKVQHLELPATQSDFVGTIAEMTADADPDQDFFAVRVGDDVVGFFKIDRQFSRTVERLPQGTHGFRGLLIGAQYQGQGHGRALLKQLPTYIAHHYTISDLWLSVDAHNTRAIRLYEKHGWRADGPPRQGRIAMETVMRLTIPGSDAKE
ncbi:MAG: GNAT family N-acetyltransferase [Pseudomonadota bacterium]